MTWTADRIKGQRTGAHIHRLYPYIHIPAADIFDLREHLVSQIRVCGQIFRHLIHLGNGTAKLLAVDLSFIGLLISTLVLIIIDPVIDPADPGGCDHIPYGHSRQMPPDRRQRSAVEIQSLS